MAMLFLKGGLAHSIQLYSSSAIRVLENITNRPNKAVPWKVREDV